MNKAKMIDAIEFKLLNPTATQAQVAEIIGISDRQLRNWENDAKDKSGWNGLNKEYADKAFGKYALPAIATLVFLSKYAKSEMVRMQSSQDILDRAGYKPTDKQEISIDEPIVLANSWVDNNGNG
ncbi:helix-turn-helix transcriptional regulator [Streptococcus suis]|uniref:helix-turn-helix transcriptional regulator n=1 Tax=Streptococcus suis TaxID=1307 RepID=UPI0032D57E31